MNKITPIIFFNKVQNFFTAKKDSEKSQNTQTFLSDKQNFNYFNAMKNYNLAFLGAINNDSDKLIYIIDAYGNYAKLSITEASERLNLDPKKILKCAKGKTEEVDGFMAAFPENIEISTKTGNHNVDNFMIEIVKESLKMSKKKPPKLTNFDLNISSKENKPKEEAKQETKKKSKPQNTIKQKTEPKNKTAPQKNQQGRIYKSIDKIKKLNDFPQEDLSKTLPRYLQSPFYVMNENLECEKFYLRSFIAKQLGVGKDTVALCVKGKTNVCQGYAMAEAKDIELLDKDGKVIGLDLETLKSRFKSKEEYFYAVNEKGECFKLDSIEQAAEKLEVTPLSIAVYFLHRQQNTTIGNHILMKRDEIEIKRKNGTVEFDSKKIKQLRSILAKGEVYIINLETKEKKKYKTKQEAADALDVSYQLITNASSGYNKTAKGFAVINANEIESYSKSGAILINEKKIDEIINNLNSDVKDDFDVKTKGFFAIKENYAEKFYSYKDAQKEIGANPISISNILKGKGVSANGYVFARASEIEKQNKDGTIEPSKTKIIKKLKILDKKAVYAITADSITRYDDQKSASKDLEIDIKLISACIRKIRDITHNTVFVPALEVEKRDKDGKIIILEDKIEKIRNEKLFKKAV